MNQLVLSHELRHALQDQHVNVEQALGDGSDFDDGKLAVLSLLEGDASLLMEKYLASGGSPRSDSAPDLLSGLGAGVLDTASLAEVFAGPELRAAPPRSGISSSCPISKAAIWLPRSTGGVDSSY